MRRFLVVAHETLLAMPLSDEVKRRVDDCKGDCHIHVVVPMAHGMGAWTEGQARAMAARQLEHGEARFKALGATEVTGEVGDASPVLAVGDALIAASEPYDEVIVSTLPPGRSRWLRQDVFHRLTRAHPGLKISHVVSTPAQADTTMATGSR